jgi:hypothetical protein
LAPGASAVKFIGSVTRLSIWPGDHDDMRGIAAAFLDREDIFDDHPIGRARAFEPVGDALDLQAAAAGFRDALKFARAPIARGADAAFGIGRRRQRVAGAERHQLFDRCLESRRIGGGSFILGESRSRSGQQKGGEQALFDHAASCGCEADKGKPRCSRYPERGTKKPAALANRLSGAA